MSKMRYVAVDLGAESGRVMVGTLADGRATLEEIHRFPNVPVRTPDGLHWDILRLYAEILAGLGLVAQRYGSEIAGIGIDSWAVDYGLLDGGGRLLGNPYHYRDSRTDGVPDEVAERVSAAEQYARTGIAQLPFNTLYQLYAEVKAGDRRLELAASLHMIPDLLHYWLCGERVAEYTNASSTGMLDVTTRTWADDLLARLGIPAHMLLQPVQPGTVLGPLRRDVARECGLHGVPVILPATHDTAAAVAAVPATPDNGPHAYISSGTWSLLGLELDHPILAEEARLAGFTNEGGVGKTYRFLTNIMGLWLLQECRRIWTREGRKWDYDDLAQRVAAAPSPGVIVDANDPAFLHPQEMPAAIRAQLARTGQLDVSDPILLTRAILEGLALKYRTALHEAERLAGVRVTTVHIVGGGSRNTLLCQLTADACGRRVVAGPVEATALGNVLVQALGRGEVESLAGIHDIARQSAQPLVYEPGDGSPWDEREARLHALRQHAG